MTYEDYEEVECCPDEWFVWLRFETWVWAALLLVQLSMVVFLVIHGRKDKSFRQAFFVFFVEVTLVDCALALLRTSREWDVTIFGTAYDRPQVDQPDPLLPSLTIRGTMNEIILHAVVPVLGHAQPLFLTAIAVNRFTAFAFPLKHQSMWRTRTVVVVVTASLAAMSFLLGAAWPVAVAIHQAVTCSRAKGKQRRELECDYGGPWAFKQITIPAALATLTSAICCVVCFVLNVGSIAMLIVLRRTGRLQRKGPELQLFAHSLWMFLLQLFLAFQDVVFVADSPETIAADLAIWGLGRRLTREHWTRSSEWLAGVNATRKWVEDRLLFTPGCKITEDYYDDDGAVPMCPVWYRMLIGELRLRDDSEFTVRTLEQCLFALSGSVFLLIVSGNVRNAYFKFYFKWQCLSKKWGQTSNVRVFTRTVRRAPTSNEPTPPIMSTSPRP